MNIANYKSLVFDCDGVLLDSNRIKTQAFYTAALPYGEKAAKALADYHLLHGGVSRYKKFQYFLDNILEKSKHDETELKQLLNCYAKEVWKGLLTCDSFERLDLLRKKFSKAKWVVVSGGDQDELRRFFALRHLSHFFDGGIFGSPDNKQYILQREIQNKNIQKPGIFFGDTIYDHQVAKRARLDFVFVAGWSELADWRDYCQKHSVLHVSSLAELQEL